MGERFEAAHRHAQLDVLGEYQARQRARDELFSPLLPQLDRIDEGLRQSLPHRPFLTALDGNTAAFAMEGIVYVTQDGGRHWQEHPLPSG